MPAAQIVMSDTTPTRTPRMTLSLPAAGTAAGPEAPGAPDAPEPPDAPDTCLVFAAGGQDYGIDTGLVREIRGWSGATALPGAPDFLLGVMDLRGTVLSVVDLSAVMGGAASTPTPRSVVVVAQTSLCPLGLLVDAVRDIVAIPRADRQAPPAGLGADPAIVALALSGGRILHLLDPARLPDCRKGAERAGTSRGFRVGAAGT